MAEIKAKVGLSDIYKGYGKQSADNVAKGGKNIVINVRDIKEVEFTEDFKVFKKGAMAKVSKVAFDYYNANKVIKEL